MKKCIFILLLIAILCGCAEVPAQTPTTEPAETQTTAATEVTEEPTVESTQAPTTEPEPAPEHFTLTFVGDCTLGSEPNLFAASYSFVSTIGDDYDYPFANVAEYFQNDDFTMVNLEGVFADSGYGVDKRFTFRGPTAYTQILTGSSVEAVTLANNHTEDFGKDGYNTTKTVLEEAGVWYVEEDKTQLVTTDSGLTIGLYADAFNFNKTQIQENVQTLRDAGAEIVICAFHWGVEGSYRANSNQEAFAKAAIDAGADIVYGHHPHVLQKIEEYNGGIIYYSLGNFSFGGNRNPKDKDSAVLQQEVIRDVDGNVRLGELTIIPVSISSVGDRNNYQPTPYEVGSEEYDRAMSKLDGTFTGPDLVVSYEDPTEPTESTDPTDSTESGESTEPTGSPDEGSDSTTPPATEEGGTDTPGTEPGTGGEATGPAENGGETVPPDTGSGDSGAEQTPPPAQSGDAGTGEG